MPRLLILLLFPALASGLRADRVAEIAEIHAAAVGGRDRIEARVSDLVAALGPVPDRNALLAGVLRELAGVLRLFDRDGLHEPYAPFANADGLAYGGGGATSASAGSRWNTCGYDPVYAYRKVMLDFCGRSPTVAEATAFDRLKGKTDQWKAALSWVRYQDQGLQPYDTTGGEPGTFGKVQRRIDDEGNPTQCTTLIEDGILRGYIHDSLNARLMGMPVTGNGRRESFAHVVMPRMTNTCMLNGDRDPAEILASVKDGLYAVNFGGGHHITRPGYDLDRLVPLAASVELLHTATLVHDDVIDDAEARRGEPTPNALFGNAASVMLGDYMFAHAADFIAQTDNTAVVRTFARTLMMMASERMPHFVDPTVGAIGRQLSFKQMQSGTVVIGGGFRGRR